VLIAIAARWLAPGQSADASRGSLLGFALSLLPIVAVSICDDVQAAARGPSSRATSWVPASRSRSHLAAQRYPSVRADRYHRWLRFPLSVVWLVGTTNAFNIVDGLDGLAAGSGFISACGLWRVLLVNENTMRVGAHRGRRHRRISAVQHLSGADVLRR